MKLVDLLDRTPNLAERIDQKTLDEIGHEVVSDFEVDLESRREWEDRTKKAMDLALQVAEKKNYPWPNASNVKFPLLTIAAMQFSSRVYPQLVPSADIVHMRVVGEDPTGQKHQRAYRVSKHMSYQLLEEDEGWEEEMDKLLVCLPLIGSAFKKSYFDPIKQHNISENVLAKDLVVNYWAKGIDGARKTHVLYQTANEIEERVRKGIYLDVELSSPQQRQALLDQQSDNRQGVRPGPVDSQTPFELLEQHRTLDLDEDGYEEPYVVTVLRDSAKVLRIVPRFRAPQLRKYLLNKGVDEQGQLIPVPRGEDVEYDFLNKRVIAIHAREHFTHYQFIPSPDGGFYGVGFGALLSPLNNSVNTILNQLVDQGHMSTVGGGFIGRGARLKGGSIRLKPNEWVTVPATGDDLRKSFFPAPIREPSAVLFQLLGYLVEYAERVASVTDMMVGKTPGQNTPATTAMASLEEGMRVFTAIYKRVYRAMRAEFRKLYNLNKEYLRPSDYFMVLDTGQEAQIFRNDYLGDSTDIKPTADPTVASDAQRLAKSQFLAERAMSVPGYNPQAVEMRLLNAMQIEAPEEIYPTGERAIKPKPDPDFELKMRELSIKQREVEYKHEREMLKIQSTINKAGAEIAKMEAEKAKLISEAAANNSEIDVRQLQARIDAERLKMDALNMALDAMRQEDEQRERAEAGRGMGAMEGAPGNGGGPEVLS